MSPLFIHGDHGYEIFIETSKGYGIIGPMKCEMIYKILHVHLKIYNILMIVIVDSNYSFTSEWCHDKKFGTYVHFS
jgi:hypothetical protein